MSSEASGLAVDLEAVVDPSFVGDIGVPASEPLLAFTNAVETGEGDISAARDELVAIIGAVAAEEAAATIAVFNGLVRVADGTGIPLDDGVFTYSAEDRARLGIDRFTGAASSAGVELLEAAPTAIPELFG